MDQSLRQEKLIDNICKSMTEMIKEFPKCLKYTKPARRNRVKSVELEKMMKEWRKLSTALGFK